LNPAAPPRKAWITECIGGRPGKVVVAATDYVRAFAEQVRAYLPREVSYHVLGTDGFGRSDTRANLRRFFEVDRHYIAHATLAALADAGQLPRGAVTRAMQMYKIDPAKADPSYA
jgi:pyruvate dehydrogenase E1 component